MPRPAAAGPSHPSVARLTSTGAPDLAVLARTDGRSGPAEPKPNAMTARAWRPPARAHRPGPARTCHTVCTRSRPMHRPEGHTVVTFFAPAPCPAPGAPAPLAAPARWLQDLGHVTP